jgi:hypothetical protein
VREGNFFRFLVHEVLVAKVWGLVDQRGRVFVGLLDLELRGVKILLTAFLLSRRHTQKVLEPHRSIINVFFIFA